MTALLVLFSYEGSAHRVMVDDAAYAHGLGKAWCHRAPGRWWVYCDENGPSIHSLVPWP
jgi:hypothetical protein